MSNGIIRWWEVNTENSLFWSPTRAWFEPKLYPRQPDRQRWRIRTLCGHQGGGRWGVKEREREGITDTCWYDTLRGARKSQKFRQTSKLREQLPHLERLVTGSRITIHSFTSPYLQKYSFRPSGNQTRQDRRHRKQVVNKYFNIKKLTKGDGIGGRGVICLLRFVSSNFLHF